MTRTYSIVILLVFSGLVWGKVSPERDACLQCHLEIDEDQDEADRLFTNIFNDVHIQRDLSCAECHGGDPTAFDDEDQSMWENETFIGKIPHSEQPRVCGRCHSNPQYMRQYSATLKTDQVDQYWTSKHGQELRRGNRKVAVCTSCHGVHGIYPVSDPRSPVYPENVPSTCSNCHNDPDYMAEFNLPTDQFFEYRNSVHGQALLDQHDRAAPACNDCHGNHGAVPPEVGHISDICGTCHINNDKLFQESHLKDVFLTRGFSQCEECHGNHRIVRPDDEYLNWERGAVCVRCHKDQGGKPKALATFFYNTLDSLKNEIERAKEIVDVADRKGMEVSDLLFPLEEAHQVLIQTRTSIHSFNRDYVAKTAAAGFTATQEAIAGGQQALAEYNYRRRGLFLYSLILTFFAVMLYLKIKELDKEKLNRPRP
jgi:predicted CXXCH cytochrome family protein